VKGGEEFQIDTDHTYGFIDNYFEETINNSKVFESIKNTDYNY
jgi:hypothetical protein